MNRTRTYEAMLLLDNREVKKGWQALKDNVAGVFNKHGAEVVSAKRWDERRLAYPIKHQLRGTYLLLYCNADTQAITSIRRDLEYSEAVLRYLTLVCEEVPEDAYAPEDAFDESSVRVEESMGPVPPSAEESAGDESEGARAERDESSSADDSSSAEESDSDDSSEGGDSSESDDSSDDDSEKEDDR